jgi:hypothetical protein
LFKARGLTLPVLLDTNGAVLRSFGSPGLPSSVVISPAGTIVKFHQGLEPQLSDRLKTEVNQALKSAE